MNFVNNTTTNKDKDLFFGPISPEDKFIEIQDRWIMAHVLHAAGIFPSVSQARKNGWNKPIPNGFTIMTAGKKTKKRNIFILNEK